MERDATLPKMIEWQAEISTHALTWSATIADVTTALSDMLISTHALTWSATSKVILLDFPSRISTHALTWSATSVHDFPER